MIQGASSVIELDQDQELSLEAIRDELSSITEYPWSISTEHYPEKEVLANENNPIIIYFQTGNGCIWIESYTTKKHNCQDILPDFTHKQVAELINIKIERMGA